MPARSRSDGGFTLIELLIVITVIAILAGIAIPVFLAQRQKARVAAVSSALKQAATAAYAWAGDNDGDYSGLNNDGVTKLQQSGMRASADVTLAIGATSTTFCVIAEHALLPSSEAWRIATYEPSDGAPTAADTCDDSSTPTLPVLPVPLPSITLPDLPNCNPPVLVPPLCD